MRNFLILSSYVFSIICGMLLIYTAVMNKPEFMAMSEGQFQLLVMVVLTQVIARMMEKDND